MLAKSFSMEGGPAVKSKQFSVPVKVKRNKVQQQHAANNKNFLTATLEQIAIILKDIKDANQQIRIFKGVFQNNPDYIQIADTLFTNLSLLGKLSTRKLPELERIKEDGMLEIENSIRNLDLKLQRNYENSFGKFQKQRSEVISKRLSKCPPDEVHCHKSDTAIDKHSDSANLKETLEEKQCSTKASKFFKNETNKYKNLDQLPWCQSEVKSKDENSNSDDYFSSDQKIKPCLVLNLETEDQNTQVEMQNDDGNFRKYIERILMEDFKDVKKNLSEEIKTLKEIERTVDNQSKRYTEPVQADSSKIYHDLKYFEKFNNKIEQTVSKIEEFSRSHKLAEEENQTKPEILRFILEAQSDRLKIMEKVSVLLMQLQILFLVLIVEIPLLVLFVLALVWRR